MKNRIPCYIILDLLPLYQDNLLSEQTKADIDAHIDECLDCKKKMDVMKMQIDIPSNNVPINPLKKVRFYQKALTIMGAIIAFILGACGPIAYFGLQVLERGTIADYQILRIKALWYILTGMCGISGLAVCVVYLLLLFLIRNKISKKTI